MYDTLDPSLITASERERKLLRMDPTYVVSWDVFKKNAFPYLEVRRPFILGTRERQWKPTLAHRFAELLHTQTGKLTRVFTQNIDGLDYHCENLPTDKIVSVHGSLAQVACEGCGEQVDYDGFCQQVQSKIRNIYEPEQRPTESSPILCGSCHRPLVKPTTVLFGRSLPEEFFLRAAEDLPDADLLLVAGTSLVVSPANSLVHRVRDSTQRVVVNLEPVGTELGLDYESKDLFLQGTCDEVFFDLLCELQWQDLLKVEALAPLSRDLVQSRRGPLTL